MEVICPIETQGRGKAVNCLMGPLRQLSPSRAPAPAPSAESFMTKADKAIRQILALGKPFLENRFQAYKGGVWPAQ